jgi:hypothetical protein
MSPQMAVLGMYSFSPIFHSLSFLTLTYSVVGTVASAFQATVSTVQRLADRNMARPSRAPLETT